jgi:hypothetical protein
MCGFTLFSGSYWNPGLMVVLRTFQAGLPKVLGCEVIWLARISLLGCEFVYGFRLGRVVRITRAISRHPFKLRRVAGCKAFGEAQEVQRWTRSLR